MLVRDYMCHLMTDMYEYLTRTFFYRARTNQELHAGTRCRSASGYNTLRMLPSADECMVKWLKVSAINGSVPDLIRQDFVLGACTSNQNITDYRLQF